ncbi:hypothetical protein [Frigoriflavimonas asaccharolytica]|uniref:Uncharacterized protein n=1 Tax=Frigoriflavimonas asaccharolytica TaxID=2735899 RepID=A0A8J8G8Q9_9FLAO|nr:hypothetical protein [Frigoriflavimonas asaccharolytica]NRS93401.1 hypothetical protein [Frigoriflavimonas asaccharolytica]
MKKLTIIFSILFIFIFGIISAQEGIKKFLYKGKIDKFPVTLYLQEDTSGCGPKFYYGMYKYDNLGTWLYLTISDDEQSRLVMVEGGITGILSLKLSGETLKGFWISPDGSRKLEVNLKEIPTTNKIMESYDRKYDEVNYEMNDC